MRYVSGKVEISAQHLNNDNIISRKLEMFTQETIKQQKRNRLTLLERSADTQRATLLKSKND